MKNHFIFGLKQKRRAEGKNMKKNMYKFMCFKLNKNLVGLGFQSDFFGTFYFGIQFFEKAQKRRTSTKPEPFVFFF